MSVPAEINLVSYVANGTQTSFAYTYRILSADNLQVVVSDADGVETVKDFGFDYSVNGVGSYNGGAIVFTTAPTSGHRVTIRRVIPNFTQDVDLRNQGAFFAETHEDVFDLMTMMLQQLKTDVGRAAKVKVSTAAAGVSLEFPEPVEGRAIGWNDEGDKLVNLEVGSLYDGKVVEGGFYGSDGNAIPEDQATIIDAGTYG
jgi:hypothetical protein